MNDSDDQVSLYYTQMISSVRNINYREIIDDVSYVHRFILFNEFYVHVTIRISPQHTC